MSDLFCIKPLTVHKELLHRGHKSITFLKVQIALDGDFDVLNKEEKKAMKAVLLDLVTTLKTKIDNL